MFQKYQNVSRGIKLYQKVSMGIRKYQMFQGYLGYKEYQWNHSYQFYVVSCEGLARDMKDSY